MKSASRTIQDMLRSPRPISGGAKKLETAEDIERAHVEGFNKALRAAARAERQNRPEIYPDDGRLDPGDGRTPGQIFVESPEYEHILETLDGGAGHAGDYRSPVVVIPGGLRSMQSSVKARALISGAVGSAGPMSPHEQAGLLEPGLTRPLTLRALVSTRKMNADSLDYVQETSRVSNAAVVADASQIDHVGDEAATKPEGGLAFVTKTVTAKWIALWVAAERAVIQDRDETRRYIDQYLTYSVDLELEDQMLSGSGIGQDFTGILNTPGIQTLGAPVAPASALDNIRKGITLVELNGRTQPTAVVLNPTDSQNIELLKVNGEANNFVTDPFTSGPRTVWGVPVVTSDAIAAGTALVGDFSLAILFDRFQTQVLLGTAANDFTRNIFRILAEMRAAFGVRRPSAFCRVALA